MNLSMHEEQKSERIFCALSIVEIEYILLTDQGNSVEYTSVKNIHNENQLSETAVIMSHSSLFSSFKRNRLLHDIELEELN